MIDQNSYGEIQYCIKCKEPLEKARVGSFRSRGICLQCQRKRAREYSARIKYEKKNNTIT